MRIIGITGGIACGKSTVSREMMRRGFPVIDGDVLSRELTGPGGEAVPAIRSVFGDKYVNQDGSMNRRAMGMLVFADTKLPNFRKLSLDDISDLLPMIDFVTPNLSEAEYYSGRKDPSEMAGVFMEKGARNVIIKLGEQGCFFRNSEMKLRIPAYSTDTIDATGAGDNFIAGFASKILGGADIEESLLFASACGAICTTEIGAGTALINSLQVEEFIRQHSPEQ